MIVIVGVSILQLSLSIRYGRMADRSRELIREFEQTVSEARRLMLLEQVRIIYRRARVLRVALILGVTSVLFVVITVLSLFAGQVIGATRDYVAVPCFGVALLSLVGSLYHFIEDVTISLKALQLEIASYSE